MQDDKRYRESFKGPREVSKILDRVMDKTTRARGFTQAAVISQWHAIIGEDWASKCLPIKLVFSRTNRAGGILHIRAPGSVAIELQHLEPILVERINRYFGFHAVARFSLSQSPIPKLQTLSNRMLQPESYEEEGQLDTAVSGVVDKDLRAALIKLGRGVIRTNTTKRVSIA